MFWSIFTFWSLCIMCYHVGKTQVILDQSYLRSMYSLSATSMNFQSKSISHIDHNAFAGVTAIQTINLSNNFLTVITQALNPYYYYLVYATYKTFSTSCSYSYAKCYNTGAGINAKCAPATHFTNLLTINLSKNKIAHIDKDSMLGAFCQTLDLSFNNLNKIVYNQLFSTIEPQSYLITNSNPFNKLKTLNLNGNKLKEISELFTYSSTYYPQLTDVYLNSNLIEKIGSDTFKNVKSLIKLDLANNKIIAIEGLSFQGLTNLRQVFIHDNPLTTNMTTPSMLQILQLCIPANPMCILCFSTSCTKSDYPYLPLN